MEEIRPARAVCKGICGKLLRLPSDLPSSDDGLKSEYKDGYCKQCYDRINFYKHIQFENEPTTY